MIAVLMMLGCSTHVGVTSTSAVDAVEIHKGAMPVDSPTRPPVIIATGVGHADTRTPYVLGRRFWVVTETPDGVESIQRIRGEAKPVPIVACVLGAVSFGAFGAWGCLYVSGPAGTTIVQSPTL